MSTGQTLLVAGAVLLYIGATVYVKFSKPGGIAIVIAAALMILDQPAEAA